MKKNITLISIFLIFAMALFFLTKPSYRGTYMKVFSKKVFFKKLKSSPNWITDQIEDDLASFDSISIKAIDTTYETIKKNAPKNKQEFIRYRIVDNKLYRYFPRDEKFTKREFDIEKAIKTLLAITKMDDLDFIYSDQDGTVLYTMKEDFYLVGNKDLQAPIFSKAKNKEAKYVVLIPDHNSYSHNWYNLYMKMQGNVENKSWDDRKEIAFWRGGSNDKFYTIDNYEKKPRYNIAIQSLQHPSFIDAGITSSWGIQLSDLLENKNIIKSISSIEDHLNYKYLPVLDGYMCTYPGYQWRLLSKSLCFKQASNEIQWFYRALLPYTHFIPIENDTADLIEKIKWARSNDIKCKQIAENAYVFAKNNLMIEDIYLYLYKVLKNYAKLQDFTKKDLKKEIKSDPNWICIQNRKKANQIMQNATY